MAANCTIANTHALHLNSAIIVRLTAATKLDNKTTRFYVFTLNANEVHRIFQTR